MKYGHSGSAPRDYSQSRFGSLGSAPSGFWCDVPYVVSRIKDCHEKLASSRCIQAELEYQGVVFTMTPFPVYLFDSRRTCFVQHLRIQSFTHSLLFVFVFLCSSSSSSRRQRRRRIRTHAIKPNRAAATFLFFLYRIVTILINGYSNAGHYRRVARTVWRGIRLGVRGCPPGGGGRAPRGVRGQSPGFRKFSIFLLKIDHSETSEFMILGSLHR